MAKQATSLEGAGPAQGIIEISAIVLSGRNSRADLGDLSELAASIAQVGIIQPLVVRDLKKDQYELIAGHRRLEAAKLAGVVAVPCLIRSCTDTEADQLRAIENLQRVNLNELEEAQDMRNLQEAGQTVAQISAAVGKSESFVHQRLQLLKLSEPARKAFLEGKFPASHGVEIARLPKADQNDVIGKSWAVGGSLKSLIEYIGREYTLPLSKAPWDKKDAELLPKAGACDKCPRNTTNFKPGPGETPPTKGRCTDKPCYEAKRAAHNAAELARLEAERGEKLIPVSIGYSKENGAKFSATEFRIAKKGDAKAVPAVVVGSNSFDQDRLGNVIYIVPEDSKQREAQYKAERAEFERKCNIEAAYVDGLNAAVPAAFEKSDTPTQLRLILIYLVSALNLWREAEVKAAAEALDANLKPAKGQGADVVLQILYEAARALPEDRLMSAAFTLIGHVGVGVFEQFALTLGVDAQAIVDEAKAKFPKPAPKADKPKKEPKGRKTVTTDEAPPAPSSDGPAEESGADGEREAESTADEADSGSPSCEDPSAPEPERPYVAEEDPESPFYPNGKVESAPDRPDAGAGLSGSEDVQTPAPPKEDKSAKADPLNSLGYEIIERIPNATEKGGRGYDRFRIRRLKDNFEAIQSLPSDELPADKAALRRYLAERMELVTNWTVPA